MAINPSYNHSEIQRYLLKQMSPSEMHAFEKEMMNDPFLADALEGFQQSDANISTKHLAKIEQQISPKKDEAKVVALSASAKWLRVAAIFLVLIGAGVVTFKIFDKKENKDLAAVEQATSLEFDSIGSADKPLAQQRGLPGKSANDNTLKSAPLIKDMPGLQNTPPSLATTESALDTTSMAMIDTSNQAQTTGVEEVALSSARAPKELSRSLAAKNSSGSQPKEGWVHFQTYVDKEVDKAKDKNSSYSGNKVELEFSVDNEGHATDIKVINTTNSEVAKVAIEILRKSPRWTPSVNNAKARIVINF